MLGTWLVWLGASFGLVGFYQKFMTLEAAGRSTIPLKLLEYAPLLVPVPILLILTTRRRRALAIYAAGVGIFLGCLPWLSQYDLFYKMENPYNDRQFDAALWQANAGSQEFTNPRGQMVRDLLVNHLRVGMKHEEALSLLGSPEGNGKADASLTYILGLYSGIIDHEFLTLRFQDGKLVSAYAWEG